MKSKYVSALCRLTLLAALPGALWADLPVLAIPPASTPAQVQAAKAAFDNGSIVTMKGGAIQDFEALLNISMPQSDSHHRQPPPCVQAARKLPSGQVKKFIRISQPFVAGDDAACGVAFTNWVARQNSLEDTSITNWTHIEDLSLPSAFTSAKSNSISLELSVYRANTIDPDFDYYLALYTNTVVQASTYNGRIDYVSLDFNAQYLNGVTADFFAYGPQGNSTTISIGQNILFDQNIPGTYTGSASTAPTAATVFSPTNLEWAYLAYQGPAPPSPYVLQTAVIYRVPTGTTHLTLSASPIAEFGGADNLDIVNNNSGSVLVPIAAPQVLLPALTFAMEGVKSSFEVGVSTYLQTGISGVPEWMSQGSVEFTDPNGNATQAPPTGQSSFAVSFNVPANPPCLGTGACTTVGTFAMQTDPAYAAIQTKPLSSSDGATSIAAATIDLVPNSPTAGVLIAGGQDWNGNILKTADVWNSTSGTTTPLQAQMVEARHQHTATFIAQSSTCQAANANCLTTGQVLIAGGYGANGQALSSTELYNPATTQFTAGPSMTSPHAGAVAIQLQDGRILIMGGFDQSGQATAVVDIYDPRTNTFSSTPMSLTQSRWNFAANVLLDGSVLVEGGAANSTDYQGPASSSAEKLDNCGSGFYPLPNGPVTPRQDHSTVLLKNGQVLMVGGYNGNGNLNTAELFTPASNTFSSIGDIGSDRRGSALIRQEDGDAALIGGDNLPNYSSIYDPASQSFDNSLTTFMTEQRDTPTAVRLEGIGTDDKGKILVAGGVILQSGSSNGELVELYDPVARTWSTAGNLSASRRQNTMTLFGKYAGSLPATFGCN